MLCCILAVDTAYKMHNESQYSTKCQQLLRELKNTVEGLLVSQVANVWSIFGGLNRLHSSVEKIFKHACVECTKDVSMSHVVIDFAYLLSGYRK